MSTPLHPNLARLAASYDQIVLEFRHGRLDADTAKARISELVARDDDGVLWAIHPDSGAWTRRTVAGEWVPGTPPTFGLPSVTAHDVSAPTGAFNPDHRLAMYQVDESLLHTPGSLRGATRQPVEAPGRQVPVKMLVCAVVAFAVLVVLFQMLG